MKELLIALLLPVFASAQEIGDTKVIVKPTDTINLYQKVKIALVKNDFIVKEDGVADTLSTYPNEMKNIPGKSAVRAVLLPGGSIELSGAYGLTRLNDWGYTENPKNYKRIIYFKGSNAWKLLLQIADMIPGGKTFGK